MNGGFCMQLKIHGYERLFRKDPEYKQSTGIYSENVKILIRDLHGAALYVPDTARWFVSEQKDSKEK